MQVSQIRAARWAITGGLAAFLAIAAAGFPTQAHAFVCNGQFDILQKGYCSTTITQGCGTSFDAACPAGETCKTFNFVDPGDPEKDGADQLRISLAVGTSTITGPAGAPNQMTLHKVRFDLDCVANSGGNGTNSLCMDQGDVVEYMGDTTISTDCPGVTWTSSQPLGGVGANEVAFTPSAAIVIPQSCAPSQQSPPPACGGCKVEFGVRVVHQEPAGSDTTPQLVEEAAGYIQGQGDAVCNEGLTGSLQSGSTQTANIPICPSCTIDQCNLGCDEQVTGMCQAQTASTPCADTDGNSCTTAGCELSPSDSTVGVCVQTHLLASNNTPCGTDEDTTDCLLPACVSGVCEQKTIPDTNKVNMPCTSTPDTPNNCLVPCCDGTGVCAESSSAAQANPTGCAVPDSTPCADTDGSSCTTAGCDGQGTCDQNHVVKCCSLSVEKTACVAPAPPPAAGCTGGAIALTLQYTGSTISGPTTVVVTGSSGASVTYDLPSLTNGDVLTTASENGFTIDATAHGQSKLGSKTTVTINGVAEVLHTSCSCKATPDTNLALCDPMCLDSSSPDNTTGFKGAPSPLWTLVGLKDPTLGTETCGGGGTTGECQTALPAGGADVEFTYKITNTGTTTVSDLAVEDDKLGIIDASQIVPLDPGQSGTLTTKQFVASTTRNTVTVTGNDGACMATAKAAVVAPCVLGYPFTSQNPRTSVAFNESEVLRAFRPATVQPGERLMVFYNDEHALTLGVRKVLVKSQTGTTMMTFPFTLLMHNPDGVESPQVGTTDLNGDNAGTDTATCTGFPDLCDRPLFPALFITDITMDPDSRAGDWQFGVIDPDTGDSKPENTPIPPNAVFGTWKGAVRTVDKTKSVPAVTVTPDTDPAKNHYNLDGGDTAPSGLTDQGYGAEVAWNVDDLLAAGVIERGHVYRVQFMVHDGDQNKVGGDTGEGCATVFVGEE